MKSWLVISRRYAVHVGGIDGVLFAVADRHIGTVRSREFLAALDDFGQPAIVDVDRVAHAALALELESDVDPSTSTCLLRMVVKPND